MTDAERRVIKDIIAAANPCNACTTALRGTCESLGRCDTRDAWRQVEREVSLMEAVCEEARTLAACFRAECDPCTPDSAIECRICTTSRALSERRKEHHG